MKKLLISCTIFSAILLGGCKNDALELTDATEGAFVATIEKFENDAETKTSLSNQNTVVWTAGDQITIFQGAPVVSRFEVDEACEGAANGVFNPVQDNSSQSGGFTSVMEIAANVAVYPYADGLTLQEAINEEQEQTYTIANVTVPAQQEYVENSFPNGAFTMVAVTESAADKVLKFKNVLGAMKLQLLGEGKVKSIEVKGNNGEILSGKAKIAAYKDSYVPVITMLDETATTVTLNCGEGVQLNPDNATNFIIALPPTNFEEGFTVTITDAEGNKKEIKTTASNTVQRSYILKMPKLNINHLNAGEELDYILFEDEIVEELCVNVFDTNNDGKLQFTEAAAVTDLRVMPLNGKKITSFNELKYFTSLKSIPGEYFMNTGVKSVVIPEGVEVIGYDAFRNNTDIAFLEKISLPSTLKDIRDYAFYGVDIKNIILPESLRSIGSYAFYGCGNLESIVLPESVGDNVGAGVFKNCTSLRNITLPSSLSGISGEAFRGCESLTTINLPESLRSIYDEAFKDCKSLVTIDLPESFSYIGEGAFEGCKSLVTIDLPESIVTICIRAFSGCSSLRSIEMPDELKYFGQYTFNEPDSGEGVFSGCTALEKIELPSKITSIPAYTFEGCISLKEIKVSNVITKIEKYAFSGCSMIRSLDFISDVTEFGEGAFMDCVLLNGISLNSSITSVEKELFSGCYSLEYIIPETIQSIGESAFAGCKTIKFDGNIPEFSRGAFSGCAVYINYADVSNFKNEYCGALYVDVPEGVTEIADKAFYYFYVGDIIITGPVTTIGKEAFKSCNASSIILPASVKNIKEYAFQNCNYLESIEIPSGLESIGNSAFYSCSALESIEIPSGVKSIENDTFQWCRSLKSIQLPSGLESIGNSAFYNCSALESIEIPSGLESIGNSAFYSCSALESIEIPASVESIGNRAFHECSSLTSIQIPSSVKSIGYAAFYRCSSLSSIQLSSGLESIDAFAFQECSSLISIQIPSSVKSIADGVLYNCTSLQSCTIESPSLTSYGSSAFYGCSALTGIYVPATSVDTYKVGWPDYASLIKSIQ